MRKIEWLFLLVGGVLLALIINHIGWRPVLEQIRQVKWYFPLILFISGCRYFSRTIAWRCAFPGRKALPSFGAMFQVRLAGEALNYLSFAGPLLGEPTKAVLLRERVPLSVGLGGTVLEAGSYAVSSGLVVLVGLSLALMEVALEEQAAQAGWLVAGLLALTLLAVWVGIRRQAHIVSTGVRWLGRGPLAGWANRWQAQVGELEDKLFRFYLQHTRSFRRMFLWDCGAQVFAMMEIYIILGALGFWVTWADLLIIEALSKVITAMFFFVPGRVGTDEGGLGVVLDLLGFGLAAGVGLALVQRLRAVVWSVAGVATLSRFAVRGPV